MSDSKYWVLKLNHNVCLNRLSSKVIIFTAELVTNVTSAYIHG